MKQTSEELRELSDQRLDNALGKSRKRSWDEVEQATDGLSTERSNVELSYQVKTMRQRHENISSDQITDTLASCAAAASGIGANLVGGSEATICLEPPANQGISSMPMEAAEENVSSLELLDNFDSPLMQIMNGVPLYIHHWPMDQHNDNIL